MKTFKNIVFNLLVLGAISFLVSCDNNDLVGVWYNQEEGAVFLYDKNKGYSPLSPRDTFTYEIIDKSLFVMKDDSDSLSLSFKKVNNDTIIIGDKSYCRAEYAPLENKFYSVLFDGKIGFLSIFKDQILLQSNIYEKYRSQNKTIGKGKYLTFISSGGLYISFDFGDGLSLLPLNKKAVSDLLLSTNKDPNDIIISDLSDFRIEKNDNEYEGKNYVDDKSSDGWKVRWYENGVRAYQCLWYNRMQYGYETYWNSKGDLISHTYYWEGSREGSTIKMPEDGKSDDIEIINYKNDRPHGRSLVWSNDLFTQGTYSNGIRDGQWKYITSQNKMMVWQNGREHYGYSGQIPSVSETLMNSLDIFIPYSNLEKVAKFSNAAQINDGLELQGSWLGLHKVSSSSFYSAFASNGLMSFYDINIYNRRMIFTPLKYKFYKKPSGRAFTLQHVLSLNYDGSVVQELSLGGE